MINISVAVAAHPKRRHLVQAMLEGPLWGLADPDNVHWDRNDDPWDTHQRAWSAYNADVSVTHHLVLQDDAVLCANLPLGLAMALPHIPADAPGSLYFGNARNHPKITRAVKMAEEKKASWIVSSGFWWGVAILLPTTLIPDMLEFCADRRENYDRRLTIWAENRNHPVYYPWPSWVDHVDEESLIHPGRRVGRNAYKFVGRDFSALSFNPTRGWVPCGRVPARMGRTA